MLVTTPPVFPARPADGHKGTFGRVLVVAGSRGMSGAACLAGVSALRGGAGLVFLAVPSDVQSLVAGYEPSYLTLSMPCDSETGQFAESAAGEVLQAAVSKDAIALGPGLGTRNGVRAIVSQLLTTVSKPMVVDADALNVLASDDELRNSGRWSAAGPRIITPHPGEFSRLTGRSIPDIEAHREEVAVEFAKQMNCIVLLKGPQTLITDGEQVALNTTGNSGMATGGSGDVLTGVIAALLAQGLPPFEAARTGAYWHGLAGDLAAKELSQPSLIASDLPRYLGRAWLAVHPS